MHYRQWIHSGGVLIDNNTRYGGFVGIAQFVLAHARHTGRLMPYDPLAQLAVLRRGQLGAGFSAWPTVIDLNLLLAHYSRHCAKAWPGFV